MKLPYGVTTAQRTAKDGGSSLVFVMNFRNEPVCVEGLGSWTDAESAETIQGVLELEAFQCRILKRQ